MNRLLLPTLLSMLLVQATPALADSSASASIDWSSLNIQIVDLSGGTNTPVFAWTSEYGQTYAAAYTTPSENVSDGTYSVYDFTTLLSSVANTSVAQANSLRSGTTLASSVASQAGGTSPWWAVQQNSAYASASNSGNFTLTGQGIAIITMDWDVTIEGAAGDWNDYAHASAWIHGYFSDSVFNSGNASSGFDSYSAYAGNVYQSGTFAMAVLSTGGTTIGALSADIYVAAHSPSVPVPEPETYALMLAGLGLVGWMARRRKA